MKLGKLIPLFCMLLGFVNSEEEIIDPNCDYEQELEPGRKYYVYNPDFPNYYIGENNCQWKASSNTKSPNCTMDYLKVKISEDIEYKFCGINSFALESIGSNMKIQFHSRYNTYGGKFQCTLTAAEEECKCGWKNPSRIVGGTETGVNEYPMMAGLVDFLKRLLFCGATIITPRHVVTAAHCITQFLNNTDTLGVIVGEHDVSTGADTNAAKLYKVNSIIVHPQYMRDLNDVAVVKIIGEFEYSMRVGPACLPLYYTQENFVGQVITALGWGTTEFGGPKSDVLMKVDLKVISGRACLSFYQNLTQDQLCTYNEGKDACQFDSGGPELWQNPAINRLFLLGVISYGRTCADEAPGVAMRVTSYLDFILYATPGKFITLLIMLISVVKPEKNCKCGWKNPSRIVNGIETGVNEFPMMAGIIYSSINLFCGGTIITQRHILTAAHCVSSFKKNNYTLLEVIVGKHDLSKYNETNVTKRYPIDDIIIHPNYISKHNDLAIIKIKQKFVYSMKVGPVCLPFNYIQRDFTNEIVTALGWGKISFNGAKSKVLRKVDLHVIATKDCAKYYYGINSKVICTFDVGKDACVNDSGGPILWKNPITNNLIIVGIISYGRTCADSSPGVNTRVTSYMDFIQNTIQGETYCKAY
ncbi:hypothetical protein M0802_004491 [Mischocyttarus mexicanus]|nr:hypothetical protein M0802_004491 [Mischocyttarus mexicanus]